MDAGIRKSAILVSTLDEHAGAELLRYMGAAVAHEVRLALRNLDYVDPAERRLVLDDFLMNCPLPHDQQRRLLQSIRNMPTDAEAYEPGPIDRRLAGNLTAGASAFGGLAAGPDGGSDVVHQHFGFLRDAGDENLSQLLATEGPQTIAMVLAHLPPEQAGRVMVQFDGPLQVEVVRRLVAMEEADADVLQAVEETLEARIATLLPKKRSRVAGISAVSGILKASDRQVGLQLLASLHTHDRSLADKLSLKRITFDDLIRLGDDTVSTILAEADPQIAILALVGAPTDFLERLFSRLPDDEAQLVQHQLNHLAPTRLSDVEEARRRITDLAYELAASGMIQVPELMPRAVREPGVTMEFAA